MIRALSTNKFLSDDELTRLWKTVLKPKPNRDDLLIQLAIATGARASELLQIKTNDISISNKKKGSVFIRGLKGSKSRTIPIKAELARAIQQLKTDETSRPFPITYNRLFQIWDLYRPNGKKFHALRHTFAVNLYRKTKDIRLVQIALGHSDVQNTSIYLDFVYADEYLSKALLD